MLLAFHYGNFDNHYSDGTRANAAKNGRIYADTTVAELSADFGSFTMSGTSGGQSSYSWTPVASGRADVLVVAGGGGGGGGGGGAGGFIYSTSINLNVNTSIIVGNGGNRGGSGSGTIGTTSGIPQNGLNSSFGSLIAIGGGAGAGHNVLNGGNGGSGGGGAWDRINNLAGTGTTNQGSQGGITIRGSYGGSGGGGGAGGIGMNSTNETTVIGRGGDGGIGKACDITGTTKYYSGGGGGGANTNSTPATGGGIGGNGGGGNGALADLGIGSAATPHTGGGGGGGDPEGAGGNGGSGIVLIRFRVTTSRGPTAFPFLYGSPMDGMRIPSSVMGATSNYTLFHVAKYYKPTGTPVRLRIFDGVTSDWLSGFHGGRAGVAYHNSWLTALSDLHGNQWVLSTDQMNVYRSNGTDRTIVGYTNGSSSQLSINYGSSTGERSDWAVAEVLVYDRQLSLSEYLTIEAYLAAKYFGIATIPETGLISGALINALFYTGVQGGGPGNNGGRGYPVSIGRLGTRVGKTFGLVLRALDYRGRRVPGALDNVGLSTRPVAAFSLRQLFGEYAGPQVRVRRNSDNVEADIYMDSFGGIVSISGSVLKDISSWLNGATAFVTTWYDQTSSGRNLIETTYQPFYDQTERAISFLTSSSSSGQQLYTKFMASLAAFETIVDTKWIDIGSTNRTWEKFLTFNEFGETDNPYDDPNGFVVMIRNASSTLIGYQRAVTSTYFYTASQTQYEVHNVSWNGATGIARYIVNNIQQNEFTFSTGIIKPSAFGLGLLRQGEAIRDAKVRSLIVFSDPLSNSVRQAIFTEIRKTI